MWQLRHKEWWVMKNWRFWTVWWWCWTSLLRVPWTIWRFNKSMLKEINPEYSLERQMLKLKFQYFGQLIWRTYSFVKTLLLGKIEGRRRRGWQRMRWLDGIANSWHEFEQDPGVGDGQRSLACCSPWGCKKSDTSEQLNWTEDHLASQFYILS